MKLNSKVFYPTDIYAGNGQFKTEIREGTFVKTFTVSTGTVFAVVIPDLWGYPKKVIALKDLLRHNPPLATSSNLEDWL